MFSKYFHLSFELIKVNFPTVGPPLEKSFWLLSGTHFFVPPCKNFFRYPWWQARSKYSFRATFCKHYMQFLQLSQMLHKSWTISIAVTAEVDLLTSKHKRCLWQLRLFHWHQNTNAFCEDTNWLYAVKQLFVMNNVVAGENVFPSRKKTGKLQFNSDTFKPFNLRQNHPRIEISASVYFHLHQFWPTVFALRQSFLPTP